MLQHDSRDSVVHPLGRCWNTIEIFGREEFKSPAPEISISVNPVKHLVTTKQGVPPMPRTQKLAYKRRRLSLKKSKSGRPFAPLLLVGIALLGSLVFSELV